MGRLAFCLASGRGRTAFRRLRFAASNHDGELRDQRGDCTEGREQRSDDDAHSSDGHRNLDESIAMLVLDYDALDIAFMDQVANLIDQVAA